MQNISGESMKNETQQSIQSITATTESHPHTRKTIGIATGATQKTIRSWIKKAEVTGQKVNGTERFTDEQRDLIISFQRIKPAIEPDEVIEPGALATFDPFAGINLATPAQEIRFESRDTSELSTQMSAETMAMIEAGKAFNAGIINAAMASASDLGTQLGTAQAQQIIMQAENQKNEVLAQYLASQGAAVKKQEDGSSPQSA